MNEEQLINRTVAFVKAELHEAEGGHDWFHIERVWNNAKLIASTEEVNGLVVQLGALLHDIADSKFHYGNEDIGPEKAEIFMLELNIPGAVIEHVTNIIRHI